jgi:hypothetical protein
MRRRGFLKYSAATAAAAPSVRAARADSGVVNVGIVSQKLATSHPARHSRVSALETVANEINARGGLKLKTGPAKMELIEYDDRTLNLPRYGIASVSQSSSFHDRAIELANSSNNNILDLA